MRSSALLRLVACARPAALLWIAVSGVALASPVARPPATTVAELTELLSDWPARPMLGAQQLLAKYGLPHEASREALVWRNQGVFRKIMVSRTEVVHDFPKPHTDFMAHTIAYRVPVDKVGALVAFDGSVMVDRTGGELTARCDLEAHNLLALNLAHDVATGKKSVKQAREDFGKLVLDEMTGKSPDYVADLRFEPDRGVSTDPDVPTMPGAPRRGAGHGGPAAARDGASMGILIAINEHEIMASMEAQRRRVSPQVLAFATKLHQQHGQNLARTMELAQKIKISPTENESVSLLREKGARELATLVPLTGEQFEKAYLDAMVKDHQQALTVIDGLRIGGKSDELQTHLTETRAHVAAHLDEATKLQQARAQSGGGTRNHKK